MNMTFISSSEVKKYYFMRGEAANEYIYIYIHFTSRGEIKVIFMTKQKMNFLFIIYKLVKR